MTPGTPTSCCRTLIVRAEYIPSGLNKITASTVAGFGSILEKVNALFKDGSFVPGRTALYLLRMEDAGCDGVPRGMPDWQFLHVDDIDPEAFAAKYRDELKRLGHRFAGKSNPLAIGQRRQYRRTPVKTSGHANRRQYRQIRLGT